MSNSVAGSKRKAGHFEGAVPDDRHSKPSTPGSTSSSVTRMVARNAGLCGRCARLDLDKVLSLQHESARANLVANLSAVSTWSITSCSFCRLMFDFLGPRDVQGILDTRQPSLWSYSSNRISDLGWSSINKTLLSVGRDGGEYIVPQADDGKRPYRDT
jgi:hypothetical protein